MKINTTERVDGSAIWRRLDAATQAKMGELAVEYAVSMMAIESNFYEKAADHDTRNLLERPQEAAANRLIQLLIETIAPDILQDDLITDDGQQLRVAASLGMICQICGCSEFDACHPTCGWAEPNLCTACIGGENVLPFREEKRA